jgi:aminopeptidase YwaD
MLQFIATQLINHISSWGVSMNLLRPCVSRCLVLLLLTIQSSTGFAQKSNPKVLTTLERNIRAEMNFLASDALQGRGSATGYERIAAEYIASQFRQFGLEPAGDADSSGAPGFVQRVPLQSLKFKEPPLLRATSGGQTHSWEFGRDLLVSSMRGSQVAGELQVINADDTPARGAFAVVRLPASADRQKRQEITRRARMARAAAVALLETEANQQLRESGKARLPDLPARIPSDNPAVAENGFAVVTLRQETFDQLVALPAGSRIEFGAPAQVDDSGATWNVVGVIPGSDPRLAREAIFLSAHLDHLGVADEGTGGDTIYNGADDDASGCVSVMELARALASGPRPKRTIYFVCFGSEERGGWGAQYFVAHAPVPLERMVADLNFEMLGRPDAKVAANTLWLTGFDRSNLGPELARRGARLVSDPHPEQNFFQRSDNYTLAVRGVIAHSVSSFGLHTDYHRPSDEASKIDFPFMAQAIRSLIVPVRWLANSTFRPAWQPGKAPAR